MRAAVTWAVVPAAVAAALTMLAGSPAVATAAAGPGAASRAGYASAHSSGDATVTEPPGRQWASFAYDPAHCELVLFGGNNASTVFGDTWIQKNRTWTEQSPARSPSARTGAAMVYDAATRQLLLFGGSSRPGTEGGFQDDTWIWTGTTWRRLHPATSPSARHNADMIYDAATQDVIMFGGYDGHYLNDTWAWNGTTWTQLSPATSPSPRDSESLVYDPASQTAIMFGGFSSSAGRLSDTWSWNGATWTQLAPATTPGVITIAWQAAYDPASNQLLLFGGDPGNGNPPADGTWDWNGTTWTQLSPALSPPGRVYGSLSYDSMRHRIVLFAGSSNGSETSFPAATWSWDGSTWHA
jgi:hypothetical protein